MSLKRFFYCFIVVLFLFALSCSKTDTSNPYDALDHSTTNNNTNPTEPDSNSIAGLHKNIFSTKCAKPGCHDGTFEPDYRTIQSTYSTLVYQNVNKATVDSIHFFSYRVVPNDTAQSFLFERITTSTPDYMPSNGVRLPKSDINHIKAWIMNGARDEFGNIPVKPDLPPNVLGYIALNASGVRLDTIRQNGISYLPFLTPTNINMTVPVLILDTADGSNATAPVNFTLVQIKCSTLKDDFSSATVVTCYYNVPLPYGVWEAIINTGVWSSGTTVYFRAYVNDGHHTTPAEFPRNESLDYFKTYFAFYVQ